MSKTAWLEISLVDKKVKAQDVISLLLSDGWIHTDTSGKSTYLPIGDTNDFNWESNLLSADQLQGLIEEKTRRNEVVGLEIRWQKTEIGGNLLIYPDLSIMFSISINRKSIDGSALTDINWYTGKIIPLFDQADIHIAAFKYEETV